MATEFHPDANLMGAFVEGQLGAAAHAAVLLHLSGCDQCRRWSACSLAARQCARSAAAAAPRRRTGQGWGPAWAVPATAAASLLLVASSFWLRAPLRPAAAAANVEPAPNRASAVVIHPLAATAHAIPLRRPMRLAATHPPAPMPVVLAASEGSLRLPAVPPPPPQTEIQPSIDFAPLLTGFQDQTPPPRRGQAQLASWITTSEPDPGAVANVGPAVPVAMESALAGGGPGSTSGGSMELSGPLAPAALASGLGWAISRSGRILRSIGTNIWAAVPLVPGVQIHALAAANDVIWAAGRADQLYVSPDHGAHWRQVPLPSVGAHPGAIRSIDFSDAQHGTISAEGGLSWHTADGGATWTKSGR